MLAETVQGGRPVIQGHGIAQIGIVFFELHRAGGGADPVGHRGGENHILLVLVSDIGVLGRLRRYRHSGLVPDRHAVGVAVAGYRAVTLVDEGAAAGEGAVLIHGDGAIVVDRAALLHREGAAALHGNGAGDGDACTVGKDQLGSVRDGEIFA